MAQAGPESLGEFSKGLGKEDLIFFDMNVLTKQYRLGVVRVGVRGHLPLCVERSGLEKQQIAQGSGDG